jgi:hypothetical protein
MLVTGRSDGNRGKVDLRHPHEMPSDLLKLRPNLLWWYHTVKDVARLDTLGGHVGVVFLERFHYQQSVELCGKTRGRKKP